MTRDELLARIRQLASDAADAEYLFVASLLYFVASAVALGREQEIAGVIARWNDMKDRRN